MSFMLEFDLAFSPMLISDRNADFVELNSKVSWQMQSEQLKKAQSDICLGDAAWERILKEWIRHAAPYAAIHKKAATPVG